MASVNKVILVGNLGRDPELRHTQTGNAVCNLSVATTRTYKKQDGEKVEETEWNRVVAWGKTAENCDRYLAKGRQVYVEGRLQTRSYDDKEGIKRYSTEIVADVVQFLGGKGERESPAVGTENAPEPPPYDEVEQPTGAGDDDIPF